MQRSVTMIMSKNQLTVVFVLSLQIIGQLSASPTGNGTTTPVPKQNVTQSSIISHTTTTPVPPSTKTISTSASTTLQEKNASETPNLASTIPTIFSSSSNGETKINSFSTTTATPPTQTPEISCHRFDGLSFASGGLVALTLVAIAMIGIKVYVARIDRSYWTL